MALKKKRKARKEIAPKVDLIKPLPMDILGSKDDPCFGKLNDPRNSTCQKCGDIEACAIVMGQVNNMKRRLIEQEQSFKDMEEKEIKSPESIKEMRIAIKKRMVEMIKQGPVKEEEIILDIYNTYGRDGFGKKKIGIILQKKTLTTPNIVKDKNHIYIWKK